MEITVNWKEIDFLFCFLITNLFFASNGSASACNANLWHKTKRKFQSNNVNVLNQ